MTSLEKLRQYERALREWKKTMAHGTFGFPEPNADTYELKRVEEVFCARKLREKVMQEVDNAEPLA